MIRLVASRIGRRIMGWAYRKGGGPDQFEIELRQGNEVIERCLANLTFVTGSAYVNHDEHFGHGFEFLVDPYQLRPNREVFTLTVIGTDIRREIPRPRAIEPGVVSEFRLDRITEEYFSGWAWNAAEPDTSQTLVLTVEGGSPCGQDGYRREIMANMFRRDLAPLGLAGGNVGYHVPWPDDLHLMARRSTLLSMGNRVIRLGRKYSRIEQDSFVALPNYITGF